MAVKITWQDNSTDETGFTLERSLNGGAFTVVAASLGVGAVLYQDDTAVGSILIANVYTYRVRAFNSAGASAYSNTASITIPKIITIPAAPSNLLATAV